MPRERDTEYAPQRRYNAKMRSAGFVPVSLWVPEQQRERAIKYAAKLRKDFETQQRDD